MRYYEVAPLRVIRGASQTYTYSFADDLSVGQIVSIPLGKSDYIGIVISTADKPDFPTKQVLSALEAQPVPKPLIDTALWMADYYSTHLAIVLQTILPRGMDKKRRVILPPTMSIVRDRTKILFNPDQESALKSIESAPTGTTLLHGVTGSGKTAIYIEYVRRLISKKLSAIILVPEIALTSQLVAEFEAQFPFVIVTHSRQTEAQRHAAWLQTLNAVEPVVVIGPRSALFMPLNNIGTIIIDEAHEPSYKQDQSPRYSALRVASILAKHHNANVIQGTATPLVTEYYLARSNSRPIIEITKKARLDAVKPDITLIDSTKRESFSRHRFFSDQLLSSIEASVASGHQSLIFHNRRGSAMSTLCESCGWMAMCPKCVIPLTLHSDQHQLKCHVCEYQERVPTSCPECGATDVLHKGIGTKLIESELSKIFSKSKIARFDGDTDSTSTLDKQYQDIYDGKVQIIIGTQVIAKGLDLPNLRTVGVIQADAGLSLPDFSSSERTFQLLAQVVGRVGRSKHRTKIVIQTYQPGAEAIRYGVSQDYLGFYNSAIAVRRHGLFPPFTHLLKLTCAYKTELAAVRNAKQFAESIKLSYPKVQVLGPTPAFYERIHGNYRWQLVVKSPSRSELTNICSQLPSAHWQFDIDPYSLLG